MQTFGLQVHSSVSEKVGRGGERLFSIVGLQSWCILNGGTDRRNIYKHSPCLLYHSFTLVCSPLSVHPSSLLLPSSFHCPVISEIYATLCAELVGILFAVLLCLILRIYHRQLKSPASNMWITARRAALFLLKRVYCLICLLFCIDDDITSDNSEKLK